MFNYKHIIANLALAAAAIGACGQAAAMPIYPIYHVDVDTTTLGTGAAYLDLYFLGLAGAADATAIVDHLTGTLLGTADLTGSVTGGAPGPFVFSNAGGTGGGEVVQGIQLGGKFSFDVSFATAAGDTGTTFGWALFDTTHYLGVDGDLGNLFLDPGAPVGHQVVTAAPPAQLGGVTVIPEPSTAALMLAAALGMLALQRKGKRRL